MDRSEQVARFRAGVELLQTAVAGMSREQVEARPVAGRWSTIEVVAHLADSEQAWCHRIKRVIAEDRPLLISYDENRFTAALGYPGRDLAEELTVFVVNRQQMARILATLPESTWSRQGVHTELGLVTVEAMIRIETDHVANHVAHLRDKRRALGLAVDF